MLENGKRKGSAMNIEIAQRLYELRRKHGFSQESLAAELGLSRQAISKWERSESAPDMGNLIALADLYGMTIDELIRPAIKDDADCYVEDSLEPAVSKVTAVSEEAEAEEIPEDEESETAETADATATATATATGAEAVYSAQKSETAEPRQDTTKQVHAHGHIYSKPTNAGVRPRCALRRFPYPLLIVVLVLLLVIVFGLWEYIWLFLTIPFYYWIARVIERDPIFLERHGYTSQARVHGSDTSSSSEQPSYDEVYAVDSANNSKEVR